MATIVIILISFIISSIGYRIVELREYRRNNDLYSYFLMKNFLYLILLKVKEINKIIFEDGYWSIEISHQTMKISNKSIEFGGFNSTLVKGGNLFEIYYDGHAHYEKINLALPFFQNFIKENISKKIEFRISLINTDKWE